mmetsp:Transcript_122340/g.391366  ORF Transcript_122340/g.391366 Transcript_122340/m.391366 type:complete len:233 (-) Transcript_122340:7301-7999(-)
MFCASRPANAARFAKQSYRKTPRSTHLSMLPYLVVSSRPRPRLHTRPPLCAAQGQRPPTSSCAMCLRVRTNPLLQALPRPGPIAIFLLLPRSLRWRDNVPAGAKVSLDFASPSGESSANKVQHISGALLSASSTFAASSPLNCCQCAGRMEASAPQACQQKVLMKLSSTTRDWLASARSHLLHAKTMCSQASTSLSGCHRTRPCKCPVPPTAMDTDARPPHISPAHHRGASL